MKAKIAGVALTAAMAFTGVRCASAQPLIFTFIDQGQNQPTLQIFYGEPDFGIVTLNGASLSQIQHLSLIEDVGHLSLEVAADQMFSGTTGDSISNVGFNFSLSADTQKQLPTKTGSSVVFMSADLLNETAVLTEYINYFDGGDLSFNYDYSGYAIEVSAVPLPSSASLLGVAVLALGIAAYGKKRRLSQSRL